jgi:FlaG/FlaF family flagellin (archaellin)
MEVLDSFEDENFNGWNVAVSNLQINNDSPNLADGTFSAYGNGNYSYLVAERSFPSKVKKVSLYYKETSNSYGGGYEITDSNNNRVCGFGTQNRDYIYTTGNGATDAGTGAPYKVWVKVTVTINIVDGTYNITFKRLDDGSTNSFTENVDQTTDAEEIRLVNVANDDGLGNRNSWGNYVHWTDHIQYESILGTPSGVSATASGNDVTISWDAASGASSYNVLRAPVSGGTFSQIASITDNGSVSFSYTDADLLYNENYVFKIEAQN